MKNEGERMEIVLNGEIESSMLDKFEALPNEEIIVKLNSYGGDVGTAIAIYNRLQKVAERLTIEIEGVACSAATLIACAGFKCKMPSNGLYMIHSPLVELFGLYNAADIAKDYDALKAVEKSMFKIYEEKTFLGDAALTDLMMSESWLTAQEAKSKGFVDEVTGDYVNAEEDLESQTVTVNGVQIPLGKFTNKAPLKRMAAAIKPAFAVAPAEQKSLMCKLKELINGKTSERERALVAECAKLRAELLNVQDELGKAQAQLKATDALFALIKDNVESGSSGVKASTGETVDAKDAMIQKVVGYANRGR